MTTLTQQSLKQLETSLRFTCNSVSLNSEEENSKQFQSYTRFLQRERQRKFVERKKKEGFTRISIWLPCNKDKAERSEERR